MSRTPSYPHPHILPILQGWGGLLTEVAAAEDGRLEPDVRLGLREELKVGFDIQFARNWAFCSCLGVQRDVRLRLTEELRVCTEGCEV